MFRRWRKLIAFFLFSKKQTHGSSFASRFKMLYSILDDLKLPLLSEASI